MAVLILLLFTNLFKYHILIIIHSHSISITLNSFHFISLLLFLTNKAQRREQSSPWGGARRCIQGRSFPRGFPAKSRRWRRESRAHSRVLRQAGSRGDTRERTRSRNRGTVRELGSRGNAGEQIARVSRGEWREGSGLLGSWERGFPAGIAHGIWRNGVDNRGGHDRVLGIGRGSERV